MAAGLVNGYLVASDACGDVITGFITAYGQYDYAGVTFLGCSRNPVIVGTRIYYTTIAPGNTTDSFLVTQMTASPSTLLSDVSQQSTAINALTGQYNTLNNTVSGLNSSLTSLQTQYGNLNTSSSAQAGQIAVLNGQVAGINTRLSGLDTSVASINTSLTGQSSSIGALSGQIGTLQSTAAATNSTLASLQSTVASLSTSPTSGGSSAIDSPFYLSSTDGGLIGAAILGVWVAAYAFKAVRRALDLSPD